MGGLQSSSLLLSAQSASRLAKLSLRLRSSKCARGVCRLSSLSSLRSTKFRSLLLSAKRTKRLPSLRLLLRGSKRSGCVRCLSSLLCLCRAHTQLLLTETRRRLRLPQACKRLRLLRRELPCRLPQLGKRLHLLPSQLPSSLAELRELPSALQNARKIRACHLASSPGKPSLPREIRLRCANGLPVALLQSLRLFAQDRLLSVAQRSTPELTHAA